MKQNLQQEFETEDNTIALSDAAQKQISDRYKSMQVLLDENISKLPDEFSAAKETYLKE